MRQRVADRRDDPVDQAVEADRHPGAETDERHQPDQEPEPRLFEVVDRLTRVNRRRRDPDIEVCLVDLRAEAARHVKPADTVEEWPPHYQDPFPDHTGGLPEVHVSELTPEVLGGAVAHHGALVIREMFDAGHVARVVAAIEQVREVRSAQEDGSGPPEQEAWFRPLGQPDGGVLRTAIERSLVGKQGGTWLADSPFAASLVLDLLEQTGIKEAIAGHLGERPYFSLQKSTLRRSLPEPKMTGWHQDGSFLGPDVRTMNVWISLSPCGGDMPTPGLEVVPKRIDQILPLETDLTAYSTSFEVVGEITEDTPSIVPEFAPGDGLMFDQLFLHRTHLPDRMTFIRYALECWFFAPSHHAEEYLPLLA